MLLQNQTKFIKIVFVSYSKQYASFVIFNCGANLLRAWYGPLPVNFCILVRTLRMNMALMTGFIFTSIVGFKFMFICVWKRMRQMDDNFVTKIIFRCSLMISLFLCSVKGYFFTSNRRLVSTEGSRLMLLLRPGKKSK